MKKNDFILIGGLLLIVAIVLLIINLTKQEGNKVLVMVDGKEYTQLYLDEDTTYKVELPGGAWNTFIIKDGHVDMIDANCPDKLCVKSPDTIHYNNETITCLPHNVVLQIMGGEESDVDAVAR